MDFVGTIAQRTIKIILTNTHFLSILYPFVILFNILKYQILGYNFWMNDKSIKINFNEDISEIMELIKRGEEIQARYIFNTEVYKKYKQFMIPKNELYFALEFWIILNEYLNDDNVRILNQKSANKKYLTSVYEDYQEDFKNSD